jgi:hypothetical protein
MSSRGLFFFRILLLLGCSILAARANGQTPAGGSGGETTIGASGIRHSTEELMAKPSIPSTGTPVIRLSPEFEVERDNLPQNPASPMTSSWPSDQRRQKSYRFDATFSPQTVSTTFLGTQVSETGATPPDAMGAVGPTQFIVAVNGRIRSFSKSSGLADSVLNLDSDVFFHSVMTPPTSTNFTTDPRIRFDRLTQRWIVMMIDVPGGNANLANRLMIAVSDSGTVKPSTIWTYYALSASANSFADYPTLGIDKNALYIGCNMFKLSDGSFNGTNAYVIRKSSIMSGGSIVSTRFILVDSNSTNNPGLYTPQGVDNFDTTATNGYFIGCDNASFGLLQMRTVSSPGGSPTISANIPITVPATYFPLKVPHLGNTRGSNGYLDAIDDRLFMAVVRNGFLWTAQNIAVSNSGVASSSGTRDGIRWYQLQNLDATPSLVQSGTLYDPASPNDGTKRFYWMPSIMVSGQGHAAMSFSTAGVGEYANAATVGRLADDPAGTMENTVLYTSSSTSYNPSYDIGGTGGRRWGDYSFTSLDPNDDMTFWTIAEYCNATNSYGVQVAKLLAPLPAIPLSANPAVVSVNSNATVVITAVSSSGSGFFEPGTSFPNHLTATVNGGGVTVNSITYASPTSIALHLTVAGNAFNGSRTITVTNPDGQSATSAAGILTVNANCLPITVAPATLPVGHNGVAYMQTFNSTGGTSPYQYSVTFGALPGGLTLSSAGQLSGLPSAAGTFNFTVTSTDSFGCTGNISCAVQILSCPPIAVSPSRLPGGIAATPYAQTVTANGGVPPYSFSLQGGSLPAGVVLSPAGLISGTPLAHGQFIFSLSAADSFGCAVTASETIAVQCPQLSISPPSLPSANAGASYHQLLTGGGGKAPYHFSVSTGALPPGLTLSPGGAIVGNALATGTFTFQITATDSIGCLSVVSDSLVVACPALTISPAVLAKGNRHLFYAESLHVAGGKMPIAWSLIAGVLPPGLTLSPQGVVSGIPLMGDSTEITVKAIDSISCTAQQTFTLWIDTLSLVQTDVAASAGWNLISNPVESANDSVRHLYPFSVNSAFSYSGAVGYQASDILVPLTGYWLRFDSAVVDHLIGRPITADTFAVTDGWNLIGSYSVNVPVGQLQPVGTAISSPYYEYRNGYQTTDTLFAGGGFWIKCTGAGSLAYLSGPLAFDKGRTGLTNRRLPAFHEFIFRDASGGTTVLYAGAAPHSPQLRARFELPPTPPGGAFDVRFAHGSLLAILDSASSFQQANIVLQSNHFPVTVTVTSSNDGDALYLALPGHNERRIQFPTDSITISDPAVHALTLAVRRGGGMPAVFRLYDNYPNPFNPSTMLSFDLPVRSRVRLSILNILGQNVATLIDGEREAGRFQLSWNGASGNRIPAGSGVFFVRLDATGLDAATEHYSAVKKIIMLR